MKQLKGFCAIGLLLAGALVFAQGTAATTIKSVSSYGPLDNNFNHCANLGSACEAAQATSQTVNLNGNNYLITQVTNGFTTFDVVDFRAITAGTLVSLPSNWSLATCGFGTGALPSAVDSSGLTTVQGLPCTPIDNVSGTGTPLFGGSVLYTTTDAFSNAVAFTILANGSILFDSSFTDVAFVADANSVTATPEPASLTLLGTGLATLLAVRRRKR